MTSPDATERTHPAPDDRAPPTEARTRPSTAEPTLPVGVGPWPGGPDAWPDDPRYDRELLAHGDRATSSTRYRYWTMDAIVADLDARRHAFHVAIENWQHDTQHRLDRAQRQRVPRRRGAHRRQAPLEPAAARW